MFKYVTCLDDAQDEPDTAVEPDDLTAWLRVNTTCHHNSAAWETHLPAPPGVALRPRDLPGTPGRLLSRHCLPGDSHICQQWTRLHRHYHHSYTVCSSSVADLGSGMSASCTAGQIGAMDGRCGIIISCPSADTADIVKRCSVVASGCGGCPQTCRLAPPHREHTRQEPDELCKIFKFDRFCSRNV